MILSNFSEITYYGRKYIQFSLADLNNNGFMSLLCCYIHQFANMVNDVLLYFWNPSTIYSYNIVKSMSEDGFVQKLYSIYP